MATGAVSSLAVKDKDASTKTLSKITDPNNSSYLVPKVVEDDALRIKSTFATGALGVTPAATPGVVVEIKGSATKTVRVKKIMFSGVATTAKQWPITVYRGATAIADGTPVTPAITKYDITNDAAATAVVSHFTANPTSPAANPASSVLAVQDVTLTAPATAAQPLVLDFSRSGEKAVILRGAADTLCISMGGGALTNGEKFSYMVMWEEDAS